MLNTPSNMRTRNLGKYIFAIIVCSVSVANASTICRQVPEIILSEKEKAAFLTGEVEALNDLLNYYFKGWGDWDQRITEDQADQGPIELVQYVTRRLIFLDEHNINPQNITPLQRAFSRRLRLLADQFGKRTLDVYLVRFMLNYPPLFLKGEGFPPRFSSTMFIGHSPAMDSLTYYMDIFRKTILERTSHHVTTEDNAHHLQGSVRPAIRNNIYELEAIDPQAGMGVTEKPFPVMDD